MRSMMEFSKLIYSIRYQYKKGSVAASKLSEFLTELSKDLKTANTNGDRKISEAEFMAKAKRYALKGSFKLYDMDQSGLMSLEDIK